jgi:hypothetical protein
VSGALFSLDSYDIVNLRTYSSEEMTQYSDRELLGISKDKGFKPIWEGGILHGCHLTLKVQVSEDAWGRLLYNGRLYNRNSWSYRPPKFIRLQGRLAKEFTSFFNNFPTDIIEVDDKQIRIRRTCECGGKLEYDHRAVLFCTKCHLVENEHVLLDDNQFL